MTFVLICGLPSSGNRLLKSLILAAGARSSVRHGDKGVQALCKRFQTQPKPWFALIPVRHWHAEQASNELSSEDRDAYLRVVLEAMAELPDVRVQLVSYESIVLYPEQTRRGLLAWLGLDVETPWPSPPRDENAKWGCRYESLDDYPDMVPIRIMKITPDMPQTDSGP